LSKTPKIKFNAAVARIIDANVNRAREGLRVCEEITRFIIENPRLTSEIKTIRHSLKQASQRLLPLGRLLDGRDARGDIGKCIYGNELKREGCRDIFLANIQRVKESVRVLEEFSKLKNEKTPLIFKDMRYRLYEIEKKAFGKL
jgi:thiamine-phosphate pyrophosphorylase